MKERFTLINLEILENSGDRQAGVLTLLNNEGEAMYIPGPIRILREHGKTIAAQVGCPYGEINRPLIAKIRAERNGLTAMQAESS